MSGIWTQENCNPFKRSIPLSYHTMSWTGTESQLYTATPILSTYFISAIVFVSLHIYFNRLIYLVLLWYSHERSGMNWYIWYSRLKDSLKYLYKTGPRWIWTHDHLIFFRHSNLLRYQAMSSTHTQSQLGIATPISSFAQCQVLLRLMSSSVATLF